MLLYVPTVQFFSIKTDNGSIPASLCYFFSVVFVPYLALNIKNIKLPPWYITLLCIYVYVLAIIRIPQYGLSKSILHWAFGLYLLIIVINVGSDFTMDEWIKILGYGAVFFCIAHFVYMLMDYKTVCWLLKGYFTGDFNRNWCAYLKSLTRGGRNLDATWLALGGFFVKGKKKAPYVTYLILFSVLGGSRVGVLAACVLIVWSLIYDEIYRLTKKNVIYYVLYAVLMFCVLFGSGMGQAFLGKFFSGIKAPGQWLGIESAAIEQEITPLGVSASLSGRADIWRNIPLMFKDNPLGYGVGNTMKVMKKSYGFESFEDVVHNVFFQWTIDEGVIGGVWFVFLVALFLLRQWGHRPYVFASPFEGYFLCYILLSVFQFHGAESLMVYVLGIYIIHNGEK
jgi:O-antigen ligase